MNAVTTRKPVRARPLPRLPVEAGEHDDAVRDIAATATRARIRRFAWIGAVALVLFFAFMFDVCVRVPEKWTPIPPEHVLPTR